MDFRDVKQFLYTQVNCLCQRKPLQIPNIPQINQSRDNQIYSLIVFCYNSLLKEPQNQKVYLQNPKYVISKKLKQLGQIASVLGSFVFQAKSQQIQQLASFQTTNFIRSNNQDYKEIIRIVKGIFPLTNLHKDNIPLYVPFRQQLSNYVKYGNSNWELSRNILQRYKNTIQKQNKVLLRTNDEKQNSQQISQNQKLEIIIQMLLGSKQLFQRAKNNNKMIEMIWSYSYVNYIQSTLFPYSRSKLQLININQLLQEKQDLASSQCQQIQQQNNIQQVLLSNLSMFIITKNVEYFIKFFNQFLTAISLNKQKPKFLLLPICNSIIYSILNLIIQQHKDSQFQTDLNEMIRHSLKNKDQFIENRNNFWEESLPIFYNGFNQDQREANNYAFKQNQLIKIFKKVIDQDLQNCLPFYPYFTPRMNQQISIYYATKIPKQIMKVIQYLPRSFAIKLLFKNAQALEDQTSCNTIMNHLQDEENKEKLQKQIQKELALQQVNNDYNYFIKCWRSYHKLANSPQFKNQNLNLDKQQKVLGQINIFLNLSNEQVLPLFRSIMRLPFDNNDIVFKILKNYFQGVSWIILNNGQAKLSTYFQFMQSQNFRTKLMSNLEDWQMTQLWKILGYILLNNRQILNQLSYKQNNIEKSKSSMNREFNVGKKQQNNRMILQD